jgi:deazaflavin-dependent oxidoreductase (nitroreductase family)
MDDETRRALATDRTIDITTIGRRSGRPRRIEIWFVNIEGRIFITGTPGPRDWYANLLAEPALVMHLKESTAADLAAHAAVVLDQPTRRMVIEHASAEWYRSQADVDDLVAHAPMVEVTFAD